jgi:hypothetical protein
MMQYRTLSNLLLCALIASNGVVSGSGPSMVAAAVLVGKEEDEM